MIPTMHINDLRLALWPWPHFAPHEVACQGSGQVPSPTEAEGFKDAMDRLERARAVLGRPMLLTSAYRSPTHNTRVGGARNSYHLQGRAFDIVIEDDAPEPALIAALLAAGFRGMGFYRGFIHADTGPARTWNQRAGSPKVEAGEDLAREYHRASSIAL